MRHGADRHGKRCKNSGRLGGREGSAFIGITESNETRIREGDDVEDDVEDDVCGGWKEKEEPFSSDLDSGSRKMMSLWRN